MQGPRCHLARVLKIFGRSAFVAGDCVIGDDNKGYGIPMDQHSRKETLLGVVIPVRESERVQMSE